MYLLEADDDAIPALRTTLGALGDSLVVVGGEALWNVHVHVDDVGAAVEAGIAAGRPYRIRVTHFAEQIAAANNLTVTDSERETFVKGSELAGLLDVPAARPVAFDIADQQIVASKVGPEAYLKAVGERSVTLNPRYGVLDPAQKLIVTDQSGSLAKPVPPAS